MRQIPDEARMFQAVDKKWKDLMKFSANNPLVGGMGAFG